MNWTQKGALVYGLETSVSGPISQQSILDAIAAIEWVPHKPQNEYPVFSAMVIATIMRDLKWTHKMIMEVGESNRLAPYGLIGVTARFKNADIRSYWFDQGRMITCLGSEEIARIQHNEVLK